LEIKFFFFLFIKGNKTKASRRTCVDKIFN